jgi:hypothetical protein
VGERRSAVMRVLTVRQPWAWAIVHGGKDVENRTRNIAGGYRGPVAIHAGLAPFEKGTLAGRRHAELHGGEVDSRIVFGAILGVVDLVDVHTADDIEQTKNQRGLWPTCSRWAERSGHHLVLKDPRPLGEPIPFTGALGLRTLDPGVEALVLEGL